MSMRTWLIGAVAVTAMGVSAQPGLAATVRVVHGQAIYTDSTGAVNDVRLSRRGAVLRFADLSAAVVAGGGCAAAGGHAATCPAASINSVLVKLGDKADRIIVRAELRAGSVEVLGGRGADAIRSEGPAVRALGGPGDDQLRSHGGRDTILGMTGDDLTVGGSGADLILGGAGDDKLFGRTGDDLLRGSTGEDIVIDLHGTDRLYGGADPDYLNTKDGVTGDFENAGKGPDYGCAASPFPGDVLVGCDELAGPCCILPRSPARERMLAVTVRRAIGVAMPYR
jgi:Ca2+-binding RTX toxin-like protein